MNKFYINWYDGVHSGFVDYNGDFVTDNLEERADFFNSEEEVKKEIEKIKEKNPHCCPLEVGVLEC